MSAYNGHAVIVNVGAVVKLFFDLRVLVLGPGDGESGSAKQ